MSYKIIIAAIFFSISASAQVCNDESLIQKPGIWKASPQGSTSGVPAAELLKEKKTVADIHTMVKSKYSPMGLEAHFTGSYDRPTSIIPVYNYGYNIYALNFFCEGNVIKTAHETSTHFSIIVNRFDTEIYDTAQGDRLLAEGFNVMDDMPVEKDGYWYFKEKDASLGFGMTGKKNMWLITYDGKLPYAYVTKKEFLKKRREALLEQMNMSASGTKDVLKNNEMAKGYKETEYKNDPDKLNKYMKMDYLPSKERYEKLLADNEKTYKTAFDKIDTQLKMPAAELNEQAIVKQDPKDNLSYLFTDDDDPFGKILIKPNPGYFNKKIPKSSPQFFWIDIVYNHKEPIATKFRADIMNAVYFAALKNMLGK